MNYEVVATDSFSRKLKRLFKKHRSLKLDLSRLVDELSEKPDTGTPLGNDCYKIRMRISSKG